MSTTEPRSKKRKMAQDQARADILPWEDFFMGVACVAAKRSEDPSTQVGACIVNNENKIVGVGFNGMPNKCEGLPWSRDRTNGNLNTKYPYVCHAELNAIVNKNSADIRGCVIYVTLFPCNECAKLIIQMGISEVVYLSNKYSESEETRASKRMLEGVAIKLKQFTPRDNQIVIDLVETS